MNSSIKIAIVLVSFSLVSSTFFALDKYTSSNPNDASLIRLGLSDFASNECQICQEGSIYYDSGCKRCIQDSIVVVNHVNEKRIPYLAWSNDNAVAYGDQSCIGHKFFERISIDDDTTYWIEIIKNNLELQSNFYNNENFSSLSDSVTITMCSNPIDLQYLRISNEDGKPSGNGGKLFGYIDNIEIQSITKNNNKIFFDTFNECENKSCDDLWILQNENRIFINSEKENLSFFSEVTGNNDYATLKLDEPLPNSWILRFELHIDELELHPMGKGILGIEPSLRQLIFGLPALILPFISYIFLRKNNSRSLASLIIISGVVILIGVLSSFDSTILNLENMNLLHNPLFFISMIASITIIFLGCTKIKKHAIRSGN